MSDPTSGRLIVASFNEGYGVSGLTTWNMRMAKAFADAPELGVDWHSIEVGPAGALDAVSALLPKDLKQQFCFVVKHPDENRWSVARRVLRNCPILASADVVLPNHAAEGWLTAALLRDDDKGPAVVGIVHSDIGRFYAASGSTASPLEGVVAVSRHCRDEFARLYPDRPPAVYVPYGVPTALAPVSPHPPPPLKLAYFGRLEAAQKRVLDLIPLAKALVDRCTKFELHLAGEGRDEAALRLGLEQAAPGRVHFHGPLPFTAIAPFLRDKHVFVSVSEFEGTSIAMLEAMGQGLAPVVTDVSGVRDVVESEKNGWIVSIGDTAAMAERLTALANDPEQIVHCGRAAWESIVARYSIPGSARSLVEVLRNAAAKPRRPLKLKAGHPALGVFDRRWLPNSLATALRRLAKAARGHRA